MSAALIRTALQYGPRILTGLGIKPNKQWKNFFQKTAIAGYTLPQVSEFLNQYISPAGQEIRGQLQERAATGQARPDELANLSEIRQAERIPRAVQAGMEGGSMLAGLGLLGGDEQQQQPRQMQQQQAPGIGDQHQPVIAAIQSLAQSGQGANQIAETISSDQALQPMARELEQEMQQPFQQIVAQIIGRGGQQQSQPGVQAQPGVGGAQGPFGINMAKQVASSILQGTSNLIGRQ